MPLAAGTRLGAYEILAPLGAGGMGEVYRARDCRLGREVAIKILPSERPGDETRRQRFVLEAQAASALNHPHIVTIHEIESAGDRDFIVMEYVRGRSLDTAIPRGGLGLAELLRIGIPVADALAAAHSRGIVHRDLKPANVMIGSDGAVKVLDFGLAKRVHHGGGDAESTFTLDPIPALSLAGTIVGTAAYMSPEQATGAVVDARSDIFSFGAMLYEMATGTRAFGGNSTADTLAAVIRDQPKPPSELVPGLPRELERLIMRCLRKEPERRFQAMRDVTLELQEIKEESASGRLSAQVAVPAVPWRTRVVPAVVMAAIAVAAAYLLWKQGHSAPPDQPPQRLVPFTSLNGLETQPAFSPDGEQVAFEWNGEKDDNGDIYLKLVGSAEVRRLTTDPASDVSPTWSPDGREIAFIRHRPDRTAVHAVSPITGAERKISDLGAGFWVGLSWSPDGRWLALGRLIPQQGGGIHAVPAEGGEPRTLMTTKSPSWPGYPSFSPDGRALAFRTCSGPLRCSLDVLALDAALTPAGAVRSMARMVSYDNSWAVAWTRDGRALIYESARYLWRLFLAGDRAPERIELAGYGAVSPALAAHRDRLAFVSQRNTITQHPLDTTFTSRPVLASSYWDFAVRFSPDGHRIVFASSRAGEGVEIWTASADGTGARRLVRGPGDFQGSPSFSPDGRFVAFESRHDDGSWSIFVVDAEGGVPRRLTADPGDENRPEWSPDGRWVYYTSDQMTGRNVWRIPAAGGHAEQLTTGGSGHRVMVSPDGRELLYAFPNEGNGPLLAAPLAGGAARRLLPCVRSFTTSAVGLYYIECGRGPAFDVHLVDAATRRDSVIGRAQDTPYMQAEVGVSPDGKSLLVPRGEWTRDLMLIENFR
jgi:Tol biopolymer transport system component